MNRHPPRSTLFPYTTLFRPHTRRAADVARRRLPAGARIECIHHGDAGFLQGGGRPDRLGARARLGLPSHAKIVDRKSTRLNSSHSQISYAVFCLKKKKETWWLLAMCFPPAFVGVRCGSTARRRALESGLDAVSAVILVLSAVGTPVLDARARLPR